MALREILVYPDARLRRKANAVDTVDDSTRQLVDDMAETMYAAPGIGLAAIQINEPLRIIVIDTSEDSTDLQVFINPRITEMDGKQNIDEGCLSVPGFYAPVERAETITVEALDRFGEAFELQATGLLAVCVQHEIDHLDGKVFVDHLSRLKRERVRRKFEKEARRRDADRESSIA